MKSVFLLFLTLSFFVASAFGQQTPPTGRIVDIGGGILIGKARYLPLPTLNRDCNCKYAKANPVTVNFVVDRQGNVVSAEAIGGHPMLRAASVAAIRQAKFNPSFSDGEPVSVSGTLTYVFYLSKHRVLWWTVTKWKTKIENKRFTVDGVTL